MYIIRVRRGTDQEWTEENPILADGEIGFVSDLQVFKIGNGVDAYVDLNDYLSQGPQGIQGIEGPVGPQGAGIVIQGVVANFASLPGSATVNDLYITSDNQHGYVWNGSSWLDIGPMQGPQGEQGVQGIQGIQGIQGDKGDTGDAGQWWSGTQAEYDAITTKDPAVLYVVVG